MVTPMVTLLPMKEVSRVMRLSKATCYNRVNDQLLTRPVKVGERLSAWPDHEIAAINAATIAGKSRDEIKALVATLERQRAA